MSATISRRSLLVGGAAASLVGVPAVAQEAPGRSHPFRIFMMLWRGWDDACQGFKDYLDSRSVPTTLIVRDAKQDAGAVQAMVAEAKRLRPDLIYIWGTTTALVALGTVNEQDPEQHLTDMPVVFNIVTEPVINGIVTSLEAPGRRVTGTLYITPVAIQVRSMMTYRRAERVGVVFNPREQNSAVEVQMLRDVGREQGFEVIERPLASGSSANDSVDTTIRTLVADVAMAKAQWLYIPPDTLLNENRMALTEAALAKRLPTFASSERFVLQAQGLVGLVSRYYNVGQFTGYKAEQILVEGKDPRDIPIEALNRFSLIINMQVANRLSFYPPLTMLRFAETI